MENTDFQYAGFWRRYAAMIIDSALIIFVTVPLHWAIIDYLQFLENMEIIDQLKIDDLQIKAYLLWSLQLLIIRWCYYAGMESSVLQGTIGKLALGLYVTDLEGKRIDFERATGRHFGKILSGLTLYFGYLTAGFTAKKQGLHDYMSNCLVLRK